MSVQTKLLKIQNESFDKYKYRNREDILKAP